MRTTHQTGPKTGSDFVRIEVLTIVRTQKRMNMAISPTGPEHMDPAQRIALEKGKAAEPVVEPATAKALATDSGNTVFTDDERAMRKAARDAAKNSGITKQQINEVDSDTLTPLARQIQPRMQQKPSLGGTSNPLQTMYTIVNQAQAGTPVDQIVKMLRQPTTAVLSSPSQTPDQTSQDQSA